MELMVILMGMSNKDMKDIYCLCIKHIVFLCTYNSDEDQITFYHQLTTKYEQYMMQVFLFLLQP